MQCLQISFNLAAILIFLFNNIVQCSSANRIVNGTDALPGEYPFMVSVQRFTSRQHFCAGTIVSHHWILTAAHCFQFINSSKEVLIQYGSNLLVPQEAVQCSKASDIIIHEGYNPTIAIHDIALIKIFQALILIHFIQPINLPHREDARDSYENVTVTLLGWGLNETLGSLQNQLQKVILHTLAIKECKRLLSSFIHNSNICAGTSFKGQCSGDSGGPLLYENTQIGLVSWSLKPCARKPGVFTNLSYYTTWITEIIQK